MDPDKEIIHETYRLAKENNKMLHSMRRAVFWGGILKVMTYLAFLLVPFWFYMTYLNGTVQQMLRAIDQIQGTGAKAQAQFGDLSNTLKQFQDKLPGFMHSSTSTQ